VAKGLVGLALAAGLSGCVTQRESSPPRTATEQLLISSAADTALESLDFPWLRGKRVTLDDKYFESYDKGYVVGLFRERLSASGALLVQTNADVIVEIRSGALSVNNAEMLLGIPAMTLPVPLTGPVPTPEVALYSRKSAKAYAKFALFAYERASSRYVRSLGPLEGTAFFRLYKLLLVSWRRSDIPELSEGDLPRYSTLPPPSNRTRSRNP
jgi:hypothetical protein